jgi:hypothetical protein
MQLRTFLLLVVLSINVLLLVNWLGTIAGDDYGALGLWNDEVLSGILISTAGFIFLVMPVVSIPLALAAWIAGSMLKNSFVRFDFMRSPIFIISLGVLGALAFTYGVIWGAVALPWRVFEALASII